MNDELLAVLRDAAMVHSTWETFPASPSTRVWSCRCGTFLTDSWPGLPAMDTLLATHQLARMETAVTDYAATAELEREPEPEPVIRVIAVQGPGLHHGPSGPPLDQVTPELITTLAYLFDEYGQLGVVRVVQKMQADGIDSGADAEQYLELVESPESLGPMIAVLRVLLA